MISSEMPARPRLVRRRVRRVLVGVAGLLLLAIGAAHTAPARDLVLRRVVAALRSSAGLDLRAASLTYNIFNLSAELRDVTLAAAGTPESPFGSAAAVGIRFGSGALRGQFDVRQIVLTSPRLTVRENPDGTHNLPDIDSDPAADGIAWPDLAADDLDVLVELPATTIAVRGARASFARSVSNALTGTVEATKGLRIGIGARTYESETAAATLAFDGRVVTLREFTTTRPGTSLRAGGAVTFANGEAMLDLSVNGSTELASWPGENRDRGPRGTVEVRGRLTGAVTDPIASFDATGRALEWSAIAAAAARATGRFEKGVITLESYTAELAGGTIEGRGRLSLGANGQGRAEARWSNIHAGRLPGIPRQIAGSIAPHGSGEIRWRSGPRSPSTHWFEIDATTGLLAAGRTTVVAVQVRGSGEQWRIAMSPRDSAAGDFGLDADVRLNREQWQASPVNGHVVLRTSDARSTLDRLSDFGLPLGSIDPATVAGTLDAEATLGGTLGAVRATGRAEGRALAFAGTPPIDLTASFAIDMRDRSSTGDFRIEAVDVAAWRPAIDHLPALRGSATANGTWSGPLASPVVTIAVAARDLAAAGANLEPVALSAGTFDATLSGPIDALTGRGRLVVGAVQLNGRALGEARADLTFEGRSLAFDLSAPLLNTMSTGTVALTAPYAFSANGVMTSVELPRLTAWLGASAMTSDDLNGSITASFELNGDFAKTSGITTSIDVAPLDAMVYGVPLRAPGGLRASISNGRATLGAFALKLGDIAIEGDTRGADERVALNVNGDLGSLAPWLARLDAERPWTTTGHVTGTLAASRTAAGVDLTGSIAATVTTVAHGAQVLARNAHLAIELADSRAVVRDFTGQLLDNAVRGSVDAPLTWLNAALPQSWRIRPSAIDAPGTATITGTFDAATALAAVSPDRTDGISGRLSIAVNLSTPRPDLASMTGDVRFDDAELTSGRTTLAQTTNTRLRLAGGQLTVDALHLKGPDSEFTGSGVIGLVPGARTDARLDVDSGLNVMADFLRGRGSGRVKGTVAIVGSADHWTVAADAALAEAGWLVPDARVLLDGWSGTLRIDSDAIVLTGLNGRVNGGAVRIDGRLPHAAVSSDRGGITLVARDVLLDVPRGLHSQLGGTLTWRAAETGPTIEGTVTITANRYSEPVTRVLALVDSLSHSTRGAGIVLPERLATTRLAVAIDVTDPVIIDNSVGTVELVPSLRLVGSARAPALDGRIDLADQGRLRLGGRTYRLRESRLRFAPAAGLAPTLDVTGETRVGDYDITLRITGTPDSIETTYSSSPPLGQRDLQSLIVTGRADATGELPDSDDFAVSAAATDILGFAGKFVGLDSVRLGTSDLDLATKDVSTAQHLTVSKSFGPRLELIVSDNLETGSLTWLIAWRPGAGYEVRAAEVDNTTGSLELRRITFFGPGVAIREMSSAAERSTTTPVVADVVIDGTPGFSADELRRALHIKPGDRFLVRRWIEDRLRLQDFYRTRGYHRVRIVPTRLEGTAVASNKTITLRYGINRGPNTIIEIVGDGLPSQAVSAMYDEWRGVPVTEVLEDKFAEAARAWLARSGYYRARIEVDFPVDTAELARAIVRVNRGPRSQRQAIAWAGNTAVATTELEALIAPLTAAGGFDRESIDVEVRQVYGRRGYPKAAVAFGEPQFAGDLVTRPITITEGPMSRIVDVRFDGVSSARLDAARAALHLLPGTPFVPAIASEAARRLQAYYRNLGYRDATVAHAVTPSADGDVTVQVTVDEGAPYRIGAVSISGVETTNAGLVRGAVTLAPGETASTDHADATRRNLFEIGSFRRVDVSFVPSANLAPATTDVAIQVEEPKRFQLRYGVQLSTDRVRHTDGGLVTPGATVELRDRNFIGRAVQASLAMHYERDFQTYTLLLSTPRVFGRSILTNLFARERRETQDLDTVALIDRRREISLTQRKRTSQGLELSWGYDLTRRALLLQSQDDRIDLGGFLTGPTGSIAIDRRDSPFNATRGWFHSSSVQVGVRELGSDLGYVRFLTRQSFYQPAGPVTLAGNVRFGMLQGYAGTAPLTILDQFFLAGGTSSVRGYSEGELSAVRFDALNVGGTELLVLNGEVRFPVHRWFSGAFFVDGGNTFLSRREISLRKLAIGTGIGVRVQSPLAAFRFDFGYPMTLGYGRRHVRFHFSVGQMF